MKLIAEYLPAFLIVLGVVIVVGVVIALARTPKAPPRGPITGGGGSPAEPNDRDVRPIRPRGDGPAAQ